MKKLYITTVIVMLLVLFIQVWITSSSWDNAEKTKKYSEVLICRADSIKKSNDSIIKVNSELIDVSTNIISYYDSLKHRSDSLFDENWVLCMEKQKYEMTFAIFAKYYPESAGKFAYIMKHRIR